MARDLLLEIGTEEIPAGFMEKALADLRELTAKALSGERISYDSIEVYGTPRRLAFIVRAVAERQADVEEEMKGPSKKVGVDQTGNFTKAAEGFARGQGVEPSSLYFKELNGVEYIYALKKESGQATKNILTRVLPGIISGLSFPKTMRWGNYEMRFVRPIRWLVALYGQELIQFNITDITTAKYTYGHRFLAKEPLIIPEPSQYLEVLKSGFVIADQAERKKLIWQQILDLAAQEGGSVEEDLELLEEVNYLVEYPTPLCGSFADDYLNLPVEVLITPMREHQRYFPVFDKQGKLMNKFITVRNGNGEHLDTVRQGNEKVLAARLADAKFFYDEDLKNPLESLLPKLADITFQESLGTVLEKVNRVENLTKYLAERLAVDSKSRAQALRIARLAKADLVTNMVYEFPELQGIMGAYYATANGESAEISQGIKEHYYPRFAGDLLPQGIPGWLVSIADKLDTIVGCFGVGIQPTGSQDPYALRRQALAICHLLLQRKTEVTLAELLEAAYDNLSAKVQLKLRKAELIQEVSEFFFQRMRNILNDKGHRYDVIEAVLAPKNTDLINIIQWADALTKFRQEIGFNSLLTGFTRVSNLAKKGSGGLVVAELLVEPAEHQLAQVLEVVTKQVDVLVADKQYLSALQELSKIQEPIDKFFNEIMVMVEDENIKLNRLALLNSITHLLIDKIDLTKIVVD